MSDHTLVSPDARARSATRPRGTSFAGLVGVELRRLWWRRMAKVVLLGVVLFTGLSVFTVYQATSPETLAQQLDNYNTQVEQFPQMLKECQQAQADARAGGDTTADFGCDQMAEQQMSPADFGLVEPAVPAIVTTLSKAGVYVYGFLAFLLGASFVGAEFASGSMGSWLTFQPRRLRVAASKLIAAAGGGLGIAAVGLALSTLGAFLVTSINRPGADAPKLPPMSVDTGDPVSQVVLRCVALVVLGGLGGAVVGLIMRHTAAVLGLVVGWAVLVEGAVAALLFDGALQPWLVQINLRAFLEKGAVYYRTVCDATGCQSREVPVSYTHSWVYLTAFTVVLTLISLWSFRRRDVT